MDNRLKCVVDIPVYLLAYFAIQYAAARFMPGPLWQSAFTGLATVLVFAAARWSPPSRRYVRSRPWAAMAWVALLALGTILPSQWLMELMEVQLPEAHERYFGQIMSRPEGYLLIGVLTPVAEEMVFRGAVLRRLLALSAGGWEWVAVAVSAALFGAVHGNSAQMAHAFAMGLLLGWMYKRTGSIVPGVVVHWVNNTVAYLMYNFVPNADDGTLIDIFNGSQGRVWLALVFSMCIFAPSLLQCALRLKKPYADGYSDIGAGR